VAEKSDIEIIRRAYAKRVMFVAGTADRRVEAAFAAVPREKFLAPGPWQIVRWSFVSGSRGYVATPSRDPVYIYDDVVVALLPERNLNNGQPSLHAWLIASAAPKPGEHVVHIGLGFGYYTAILAHLVGSHGKVTAVEYDPDLAARSAENLAAWPQADIVAGDGTKIDFPPADIIYVNAGATHPLPHWLDRLAEGGRLIVPLTEAGFPMGDARRGAARCSGSSAVATTMQRGGFRQSRFSHAPAAATPKAKPRSPPHSQKVGLKTSHDCTGMTMCRTKTAGCEGRAGAWRIVEGT
jgi:protein-L-isoaspartate(D-aspartate) O-methyltransferase